MKLREELHEAIDALDVRSLASVYELVQSLLESRTPPPQRQVPTLEEVIEMSRSDKSNWSDDIIADREDRL